MAGEMSPISSRKIVPPSATANRPGLSLCASVKAPALWPKSSDSSSVSGSAPQLMATKGFPCRGDSSWMSPGEELLAGAAGAVDDHRAVARRDRRQDPEEIPHDAAAADDVAEGKPALELLPELFDLAEIAEGLDAAHDVTPRDRAEPRSRSVIGTLRAFESTIMIALLTTGSPELRV